MRSGLLTFILVLCICLIDASLIRRKTVEENDVKKFVLLTTQRSGSTWACEILDLQNSITCGAKRISGSIRQSELMKNHPKNYKSWQDFEDNMTMNLQRVIAASESSSSPNAHAAGFKLMYARIHPSKFDTERMIEYCVENDVAIIHLVRDAKVLRIASQSTMEKEKHLLEVGLPHTVDKAKAAMIRDQNTLFEWDQSLIDQIKIEEDIDDQWERMLSFAPKLKYHRLTYEKMLSEDSLEVEISQILSFFDLEQQSANIDSQLLQLHKAVCPGRVANYDELRERMEGTRTAAACDYLDEIYSDAESELI